MTIKRQTIIGRYSLAFILIAQPLVPHYSFANPESGSVTHGSAVITGEGTSNVTITQSSDKAFIEWDSFSVGANERVDFIQPSASSLTANKVVGTDPSQILGQVTATGKLVIINGNGVIFGTDSVIDAAAFIATTHNANADEMMSGTDPLSFSGGTASIINNGNIALRDGGIAALLAPHIVNNGVITARLGTIALSASNQVSIDFYGDGLLSYSADSALMQSQVGDSTALLSQQGTVRADGGLIQMSAKTASDVIIQSVNVGGLVQAQTVEQKNGRIILSGDTAVIIDEGATLDASGNGGDISLDGQMVSVGGTLTTSGTDDGGMIAITSTGRTNLGGNVNASATQGTGGTISIDAQTIIENAASRLDASGGLSGGSITMTASSNLMSSGTADASASSGQGGLIDVTATDLRALGATYDASGATSGGRVRVGGAFQGGKELDLTQSYIESFVTRWPDNPALNNAAKTFLNDGTHINVSSENGAGGTAIIWSDVETTFLGSLSATGTTGGSTEISSAATLRYASLTNIDVGDGTVLLDPKNITIGTSLEVQSWSYQGVIGRWYTPDVDVASIDANDEFGTALALSDNSRLLAVGASGDDGNDGNTNGAGAVYLFTFTDGNFSGGTLSGTIGKGYSGTGNYDVSALAIGDMFGSSVALDEDGNRLAVGATGDDGSGNSASGSGAVYLFSFTDTSFAGASLDRTIGTGYSGSPITAESGDALGSAVAFNNTGSRLFIGAAGDDGNANGTTDAGAVYNIGFTDSDYSTPTVIGTIGSGYSGGNNLDISALDDSDAFGSSIAFANDITRLVVGAPLDDGSGNSGTSNIGAVYILGFGDSSLKDPTVDATIGSAYKTGGNIDIGGGSTDYIGTSVAISKDGTKIAFGATGDDGQSGSAISDYGAVYLMTYSSSDLTQMPSMTRYGVGYTGTNDLNLSSLSGNDNFGAAVALNGSGDRLAVGLTGGDGKNNDGVSNGGEITLISIDTPPIISAQIGDGYEVNDYPNNANLEAGENFGVSVALNDDASLMAVGSMLDGGSPDTSTNYGSVSLYSFTDSDFNGASLVGTIGYGYTGSNNVNYNSGGAGFGASVALNASGNRLAVGEMTQGSKGAVRLFSFTDTSFSSGSLTATIGDGFTGGSNVGVSLDASDDFGAAVSLSDDGTLLAIGAPGDDASSLTDTGAVYLYSFTNGDFGGGSLSGRIGSGYSSPGDYGITLAADDAFGTSVSLDGDGNRLAVGAPTDQGPDGVESVGAVLLFSFGDTTFTNASLTATIGDGYTGGNNINVSSLGKLDGFGTSVALNSTGDRLFVGAPNDDGSSGSNAGAVYAFAFNNTDFTSGSQTQLFGQGYTGTNQFDVANLEAGDQFGSSLALNASGTRLAVGAIGDDGTGNSASNVGAVHMLSSAHSSGGYPAAGQTFANQESDSITVNAYEVADILARGTDLTLQASNDITVNSVVQVGGFVQSAGDLTLRAGRSVDINEDIITNNGDLSVIANDTAGNGVVVAQRDSGAAVIDLASGKRLNMGTGDVSLLIADASDRSNNTSGDITIGSSSRVIGNQVTIRNNGPTAGSDIVANSSSQISASGTSAAVILVADSFDNNVGSNVFSTINGQYQIWTDDATGNDVTVLNPDFIQYNATYNVTSIAGGASENGVFYTDTATVTADFRTAVAKPYDGTSTASVADSEIGVTGANSGESVVLTTASASYDNENVGSGKTLTLTGLSVASAARGSIDIYGYGVSSTTASNNNGTITPRTLTLTGQSASDKTYDRTVTASVSYGSLSGILTGDTVSLDTTSATSSFADANVGTGKAVTISNLALSGTDAGNYRIGAQSTSADITQATVTLSSAVADSREYDGSVGAIISSYGSLSGVFGADVVTLDSTSSSASFDNKNVGTGKTVTISGLAITGANAANYTIASGATTTADITARTLSISGPVASDKTYDATTTASVTAGSLAGLVSGETLNVTASGQFDNANVGTGKTVTVTYNLTNGSGGGVATNYALANGTATADITAKSLSLTGQSASNKTYDGTTTASVSYGSLSGIESGDTVTLDTSSASSNFASAGVGTGKTVTIASLSLSGADAGNYAISDQTSSADITQATLTLSSSTASNKSYDGSTSATISAYGSLSGIFGSDTVSLDTSSASAAFDNKNVGTSKTVTISSLGITGTDAANYTIASNASTTADITAKTLGIGAPSAANRAYDGTDTASITAGSLSGLVTGESLNVTASGQFDDVNVGSGKNVTVTYNLTNGSGGGVATNYALADGSTTADITQKTLTISAPTASDKTYDGNDSASVSAGTLSGLVTGETLGVSASGQFDDTAVGTGKNVTVSYSLSDGSGGGVSTNYALSNGSTTAAITAKTLSITAPTASNKTYDGTNAITVNAGTLSGYVGAETLTVSASGTTNDADAGTGKYVTVTYNLGTGTNGGVASNYTLANGAASVDISPKALSYSNISVADKIYDGSTSATVTTSGLSGFINSETVTVMSQGNFADANVGTGKSATITFALSDGNNGGKANNYTLATQTRNADITAKTLSISGTNVADKIYDATNAASVTLGTITGYVGNESLTVSAAGTYSDANVGTGKSVSVSYNLANGTNGGLASNYQLADASFTAGIASRALGLTGLSISTKNYDGTNVASIASTGSLTDIQGSDDVSLNSSSASAVFANVNAGTRAVNLSGFSLSGTSASNYTLALPSTTGLIKRKLLQVTGSSALDKSYDGTRNASVTVGSLSGFVGLETLEADAYGLFSDANPGFNKLVSVNYILKDGENGGIASNYEISNDVVFADIEGRVKEKQDITAPMVEQQVEIVKNDIKIEREEKLEMIEEVELKVQQETEQAAPYVETVGDWVMLSCETTGAQQGMCSAK